MNEIYKYSTINNVYYLIVGFICILCFFDLSSSIKYQLNTYFWPNIKCNDKYDMYFIHNNVSKQYKQICNFIKENNMKKIGIYNPYQSFEYPLWVKLKNEKTDIYQVVIENQNKEIEPECIIALNSGINDNQILYYNSIGYSIAYSYDQTNNYVVLVPHKQTIK